MYAYCHFISTTRVDARAESIITCRRFGIMVRTKSLPNLLSKACMWLLLQRKRTGYIVRQSCNGLFNVAVSRAYSDQGDEINEKG